MLVDENGAEIIGKEFASHATPPEGGVGLMIGHFLDGTEKEIPGMLNSKRKRDEESDESQGEAESTTEENAEEESEFSPDECVDPPEDLVGKYVQVNGLSLAALNGQMFKAEEKRDDDRIRISPIMPFNAQSYWVNHDKLTVVTNRELVPRLWDSIVIKNKEYSIKAMTQGQRPCIVAIKDHNGKQWGMVSSRGTDDDVVKAFLVALKVMKDLQSASRTASWTGFTKEKFFERRDEILLLNLDLV